MNWNSIHKEFNDALSQNVDIILNELPEPLREQLNRDENVKAMMRLLLREGAALFETIVRNHEMRHVLKELEGKNINLKELN